ncbi:MAG: beta strand repeat-containing protein [Prochlorotrichaceae cyanobacterium]
MVSPVLAAGTTAGTPIRNTATATYEDPAGNPFSTESNEVLVTVAPIAGITVEPTTFNNLGDLDDGGAGAGGLLLTGQTVEFIFTVTNTGNRQSNISLPGLTDLTLQGLTFTGLNASVQDYEFSTNGGANYNDADGATAENIPADGSILVRVRGVITATAAGAPISVRLGDTGSNNNLPDTQNQPDSPDGSNNVEVRTENPTSDTGTNPANGQREASALYAQSLGSNPLAFALLQKTNGGVVTVGPEVPNSLANDTITYNLTLDVLEIAPDTTFIPADLEGRDYTAGPATFTGITDITNLILVSDAIPANTDLAAVPASQPANWTVVYTTDDPATVDANDAIWTTTPPADLTTVTRIGWVYDARPAASGAIPRTNAAITGFTFTVTGFPVAGADIANIAQVYGSTDDGDPGVSGTPVFDESGDQDPSNFDGDTPGPNEDDPESDGVGDPANHGVDDNTNTGDGSRGGEDNVISVVPPGTILNGPDGQPAASGNIFGIGPDNNHDFQNLAILEDSAGNPPASVAPDGNNTFDPAPVTFTNTLSNPGTGPLLGVLLQPIDPDFAGGDNADLPTGTQATIVINYGTGNITAVYTFDGTSFNINAGSSPIEIPTINPGVTLDYTVTVDLPADTPLSTDQDTVAADGSLVGGFPVPIIAFVDDDNNGAPDGDANENVVVNQVYTGFLRLVKQSRILVGDGPPVVGTDGTFSTDGKTPAPGNIIEYRVVYRNISDPQAGSGTNVILRAQNVVITEDGTEDVANLGVGNNWALDLSPADGVLDTLHVINTASDTGGGTINYTQQASITFDANGLFTSSGTIDPGNTVTGYQVTGLTVAPTGTALFSDFNVTDDPVLPGFFEFRFQRQVSFDTSFPPAP